MGPSYHYEAGDHKEGIALCSRGLELAPDYALGHYQRACAFVRAGRPEDALADIQRATTLDPDLRKEIARDGDFAALKSRPEFKRAIGKR